MAVTVKDVAALAGVSPSTVSRVCNDNPSISRETKEKVRRAMAELNYEPAPSAAAPGQRTRFAGVILPPSPRMTYENPFFWRRSGESASSATRGSTRPSLSPARTRAKSSRSSRR